MGRSRRFIIGGLIIIATLYYLISGAMREAIVYFKTPSEVRAEGITTAPGKPLRIGGMVVVGSLETDTKNLTYRFQITDGAASIPVYFHGVPPDLFSEGKGAVVEGKFGEDGLFKANTIMAKHAEEYSPPTEEDHSKTRSFIPAEKANKP